MKPIRLAGLVLAAVLMLLGAACSPSATGPAGQPTAAPPTGVSTAPTAPAGTSLTGPAPAATPLAGMAERVQNAVRQADSALAGLQVTVEQSPPAAEPAGVTRVRLQVRDSSGAFEKLDRATKQQASAAALKAVAAIYPKAIVDIDVLTGSGLQIVTGLKQPLGQPSVTILR